jgi:thiol-disulfide isomerase/thioredoxin
MKKIMFAIAIVAIATSCKVQSKITTQTRTYEVSRDAESKILKGNIDRALIETDTSFKWFQENMKYGSADAAAVQALQKNGSKVHFVVFGGTWCHDTQSLLPVFYRLLDKSNVPDTAVTLIGVDRNKTSLNSLHSAFKITNVPTFIVMKDGKEVGRVVEYGKYGAIDKELGEIVALADTK